MKFVEEPEARVFVRSKNTIVNSFFVLLTILHFQDILTKLQKLILVHRITLISL